MEKFTYQDYLRYRNQIGLADIRVDYKLEGIYQYKDKGFKVIMENKEEVMQLINKVLKIENTKYAITKMISSNVIIILSRKILKKNKWIPYTRKKKRISFS